MRKFKLDKNTVITKQLIQDLIKEHSQERSRILKMKNYYNGLNEAIKSRQYTDANKPSNRLYSGYASYITDNFVGYMLGQPIAYKSDNENLLEKLNLSFLYNDEIDHELERENLLKEKEKLEQSIERRKKLLSNENYVNKAPANVVDNDRIQLEKEQQQNQTTE